MSPNKVEPVTPLAEFAHSFGVPLPALRADVKARRLDAFLVSGRFYVSDSAIAKYLALAAERAADPKGDNAERAVNPLASASLERAVNPIPSEKTR